MSETIGAAQLALTADDTGVTAGVTRAKKTLATLGDAAKSAGKEASDGLAKVGAGGDKASADVDRATRQITSSLQRAIAAAEAGGKSTAAYFETLARSRGANLDALRPYLEQLRAVETRQVAATAAAQAIVPAINQVGMSARQTAAALRGVPAQFTDIVTSISAGQAPMTVLLQQGGQLKDMFGGVGPAARALGGYVMGLVTPLTVAAAAVGVLGLAYFQGSKEGDAFARAIITSGNAAGVTVSQLQAMAQRISAVTGTQHAAAEALALFVANGTLAGEQIERFTAIALRLERDGGQAVKETVKDFAELGKSPVEAATKLNEATNFLTASIAHQIKVLEDQGKTAEAARVAQEAYAGALETRLPQLEARMGLLERAWKRVADAAKGAWDAMLGIGRQETTQQRLDKITEQIRLAEAPSTGKNAETQQRLDYLKRLQAYLQENVRLEQRGAERQAMDAQQAKARLEFDKAGDQFLTKRARMEQEITKARQQGAEAGATQEEIDKRIANIRKKYEDKGAARAATRLEKADLSLDIARIRTESEKQLSVLQNSERKLEFMRSSGLVSDREYFEEKRRLIRAESDEKEAALQGEIARAKDAKFKDADELVNKKRIVEAEAKLFILRADTAAKLSEISDKQVQATNREAAAFAAARQAAEDYFGAAAYRQDFELSGFGKGNKQRALDRGRFDITERFETDRRRVLRERDQLEAEQGAKLNDDQKRRFEERLSVIALYREREVSLYEMANQRKRVAEQDWLAGAQEALKNYADQTSNVYGQVEDLVTRSFSSMEDALTQFAMTGKLRVSDLMRSILADLARLQARKAAGALSGFLSNALAAYFGGGAAGASVPDAAAAGVPGGGRAIGGPVSAGGMYEVNERSRPELLNVAGKQWLLMGNQSGEVTPTSASSNGAITIVNNTSGRIDKATEQRSSNGDRVLVLEEVAAALADPNSVVSRAMGKNYNAGRRR